MPIPDPDPETIGELYVYEAIEKYDENEIHTCKNESDVTFEDDCMLEFYQALQKILPDQEAMILMEVGNEKLQYVVGLATIVTNKEIHFVNMADVALKTVKSMIGEDFTTQKGADAHPSFLCDSLAFCAKKYYPQNTKCTYVRHTDCMILSSLCWSVDSGHVQHKPFYKQRQRRARDVFEKEAGNRKAFAPARPIVLHGKRGDQKVMGRRGGIPGGLRAAFRDSRDR